MSKVRRRGGAVVVSLTPEEATVLGSLAAQVAALLDDEAPPRVASDEPDPLEAIVGFSGAPVDVPDDPALRRLLPDAYADDESAAEFRRLTGGELRSLKTAALRQLIGGVETTAGSGRPVSLGPDEVEVWLQALNDVRLVLGTRLDVTEDLAATWQELGPDDPRAPLLVAYDWLGWLQESLLRALAG